MADEWLRADQVAAMRTRLASLLAIEPGPRPDGFPNSAWRAWAADVIPLLLAERGYVEVERVAQDGRWRALVGDLLGHIEHAPKCPMYVEYCECGLNTVLAQAQAALADPPPAPRGAAE